MAHQQQIEFCNSVKRLFPDFFHQKLVLDIGSLDINGNNQYLFDDCLYLGIDLLPGKNVDFASKGHELNFPNESLDVIISTECFEHDKYYSLTLPNIIRMLKPGGLFLFSCATTGRPEHGTLRTTPTDAPLTHHFDDWGNYYKNLEERDVRDVVDIEATFREFAFSVNDETHDLYFWGIKKGQRDTRDDYSFLLRSGRQQEQIAGLNQVVAQHEGEIANLKLEIAGRDEQVASANHLVSERDRQIADLARVVSDREDEIVRLHQIVADREDEILRLRQVVGDREDCIARLRQVAGDREDEIGRMQQIVADRDGELDRILRSRSWRITEPLRYVQRLVTDINDKRRP